MAKSLASKLWGKTEKGLISNRKSCRKNREKSPQNYMFWEARKRAAKKNLDFNISVEDIKIPECCPVLNIPLKVSKGKRTYNSPTLDRFDSSKGYVKDNINVISWRANSLKNNGTLEEFLKLIKWMESYGA